MFKKLHIFLGATVADAAARPLHWVYDKKKLKSYIKGKKNIAFFKQNRSPFYSIKTGEVSGYNDVGQVMFKTLTKTTNHKEVIKLFKKNIVKNFGPGSKYWKNLSLRKKYKKIKWKTAMKGPWIHQNILETIKNIKLKKTITGGTKVNESDGYCASLPFYFSNNSEQKTKQVIKTVANGKISEQFALAKLKIIDLADKGDKDPVNSFLRKNIKNKYFKNVIENIKKVKKVKSKPHNFVVKKFGKACSYPGTFNGGIHAIITSKNFKTAVIKTIKAGGCNCSRANFVGAYFAAYKGLKGIPQDWIKKTNPAKSILKFIA
ncbi:ADP-ribosylglycohydrolase family protein [Candidatus Pelagibacter bacterium]|nr:ADP-ribosylglycohydrolase family protein [Candidatus Pelagibacter bacterium]MDA8845203.1 ADP-ribosylglycohydrolase family protein [Candidatus Pelagibacter bacterium]